MADKSPLILGFISVQTIVYGNFQLYYYYNYINFHNLYQKTFILYKYNTYRCLNGYYSHQIKERLCRAFAGNFPISGAGGAGRRYSYIAV